MPLYGTRTCWPGICLPSRRATSWARSRLSSADTCCSFTQSIAIPLRTSCAHLVMWSCRKKHTSRMGEIWSQPTWNFCSKSVLNLNVIWLVHDTCTNTLPRNRRQEWLSAASWRTRKHPGQYCLHSEFILQRLENWQYNHSNYSNQWASCDFHGQCPTAKTTDRHEALT